MNNALFVMKYQTWITVVFVVKQVLITNNDDNIPKNYFKFKKFWRQWWGAMDCRQHDFSSELNNSQKLNPTSVVGLENGGFGLKKGALCVSRVLALGEYMLHW